MTVADNESPHRRYDILNDRWVLVSPHRDKRPWQGQQETSAAPEPAYDPDCYLCPGNTRAGGVKNPEYTDVYAFDNDFPALLPDAAELSHGETVPMGDSDPLFRRAPVTGRCRVICYSPRHDLRLADMDPPAIRRVIDLWATETEQLSQQHRYVQVFENRGATMGCSNAHPHGQIWALDALPSSIVVENRQQQQYFLEHGQTMLLDYTFRELAAGDRVVVRNDHWLAVVPWWASWPFETLVLPRQQVADLPSLKGDQRDALAQLLKALLGAYDRLFDTPFPYSMGWHGAPVGGDDAHWTLHGHFYPPLLRSATVRKHMVGFEMLGEPQRDLTPETAADRIRQVLP